MNRPATVVQPLRIADAQQSLRHVFIRDLVVKCSIGIHEHEHKQPQRLRINLDLAVGESRGPLNDDFTNVVCYEKIANGIRDLARRDHVNLVETMAEDIANLCLTDVRVRVARVRVEKLDVFEDALSAGVEIERINPRS